MSLPAVEVQTELAWLVLMPNGQAGPFSAVDMAQLFDHARVDWSSLVWRGGLKGWRPARRDPQLVTAVASARGASAWGDTQRVALRHSIFPAADTIVEAPSGLPPPALRFSPGAEPAAWSEESADKVTQVTPRADIAPEPTFADAFRSAPAIMATAAIFEPARPAVGQRRSSPNSWLPSPRSMLIVAVVAFGSGVLAAALWGRLSVPGQREAAVIIQPTRGSADAPVLQVAPEGPSPAPHPITSVSLPTQEVPNDTQLRREVKRISPDIRRCINDLSHGAEVEVSFDGPTGRAREVRVRTLGLTPGRVACITQVARQMQVDPFLQPTHRLLHRFSY